VQDEEGRDPALVRDQVRDDPDRLVADLGKRHVRLRLVEDPLERAEVIDGPAHCLLLGAARAALVVAVDVAEVRDGVGRLDAADLVVR
jgi:hypothetical protein